MASHKKFNARTAFKIIRHIERVPHNYRNKDVDLKRSKDNTVLFDYGFKKYKTRLDELSRVKGDHINTLCGVIVTMPKELDDKYDLMRPEEDKIFEAITKFLKQRYGARNAVSAIVHRDEAGQPHLHYLFVPATEKTTQNKNLLKIKKYLEKHPEANHSQIANACNCSRKTVIRWKKYLETEDIKTEKLCAADVINLADLRTFHPDLVNFLNENIKLFDEDIGKYFYTGITKKLGGNKTVEELKEFGMEIDVAVEQGIEFEW